MSAYKKYFPPKIKLYEDKIIVYLVQLDLFEIDEFMSILSGDEIIRANKLIIDSKKKQFIITRGILRSLLSGCLINTKPGELHFSYREHCKPYINNKFYNKPIEFNVSHSGDYVLIAITLTHQLGVDIEKINSAIEYHSLAKRFFSEYEINDLNNYEQSERRDAFYRCWVRKEAFIKAEGSGVSFGLDRFTVTLEEKIKTSRIKINRNREEQENWFNYESVNIPNYKTAIATNIDGLQVLTHVITN